MDLTPTFPKEWFYSESIEPLPSGTSPQRIFLATNCPVIPWTYRGEGERGGGKEENPGMHEGRAGWSKYNPEKQLLLLSRFSCVRLCATP